MPHKVVVSSTTKELYDIIAPLCDNDSCLTLYNQQVSNNNL